MTRRGQPNGPLETVPRSPPFSRPRVEPYASFEHNAAGCGKPPSSSGTRGSGETPSAPCYFGRSVMASVRKYLMEVFVELVAASTSPMPKVLLSESCADVPRIMNP